MARELELKLDIDPAHAPRMLELPLFAGEATHQRQLSAYFDTPKGKLRRNGWVLRVRQADGQFVQTIKRSGEAAGLFDREEWESQVGGLRPDPEAIGKTPLANLLKPGQAPQLVAVCRSDVDRATRQIAVKGGTIELTYDEGLVEAREACAPIHEVELELKDGDLNALLPVARKLVGRVPLKLGVMSKSERGFALADGKRNVAVKAAPIALGNEVSVAEGFAAILTGCLKHLRMNEPLLIAERDAEALHQLRVAVRRLRSAMWLFRPAVKDGEFEEFYSQLRRLTRELGAARNIDVILSSMPLNDPARSKLEESRRQLYAKILRRLDYRSFRLLIFDLLAWVHVGEWRQGKKASARLMPFAVKRLDRLWERIEHRAGELYRLSDEERHKLRIDAKKIRYALEFLGHALRKVDVDLARFTKAAEGVQDSLGQLNDLATRQWLLARKAHSPDKERSNYLRAARRYLSKLREIGPFWREAGY